MPPIRRRSIRQGTVASTRSTEAGSGSTSTNSNVQSSQSSNSMVDNIPQQVPESRSSRSNSPNEESALRTLVQQVVKESLNEITTEIAGKAARAATQIMQQQRTGVTQSQLCPPAVTTQLGSQEISHQASFSSPTAEARPQDPEWKNDFCFAPTVPASYIKSIQNGEFFDLNKLLPENLQGMNQVDSQSLKLVIGENSSIKIANSVTQKKKISSIDEWTTAFTSYTQIVLEKFPARASELLSYLELVRYAAKYHQSLGWLVYDNKFRSKAANDKSINWGRVDQPLWLRTFTVNQSVLLQEHASLFSNGPYNNESEAVAKRDGICNNFNRNRPCLSTPCRYRHMCNQPGCFGSHARTVCPQDSIRRSGARGPIPPSRS